MTDYPYTTFLMATEVLPDDRALRIARRERAVAAMKEHDLDILVLGRPANVRYVAGVPLLWNAGTRAFGPSCVLVRETSDVYLLSTWDEGVPDEIPHDHLYGITWNPLNLVTVLSRIGEAMRPAGSEWMRSRRCSPACCRWPSRRLTWSTASGPSVKRGW